MMSAIAVLESGRDSTGFRGNVALRRTLSDSLAKYTAPLPMPRVPFFFLPFLSSSETDQVWILSALALFAVDATKASGST